MSSFDNYFETVANPGPTQKIPGAVLIAADRSGQIRYVHAQGFTSVEENLAQPLTADSIFWIASCTKLMTTIAALQCVERGLLFLDADVSTIIPEVKSMDILKGFNLETGEPEFKKATQKITLRLLLTHSSGMGYDFISPVLGKWRRWTNVDPESIRGEIRKKYLQPLLYEPGEGWEYGVSIDWVGVMVERVSGEVKLGNYMQKHIWGPLGMDSITFRPGEDDGIRNRMCLTTARSPSGYLVPSPPLHKEDVKDDFGGGGVFCSPNDYMKLLIAVLRNNGTLLNPEMVGLMFQPQLFDDKHLQAFISSPIGGPMCRAGANSDAWNFGLGGILNMEDVEGVCKKGTLSWGGLPNLYWWIDPVAGVCGIYASQVIPPGDLISIDISVAFRKEVYKRFASD